MALTTASSQKFDPNQQLIEGKPRKISQEAAILFDKSIVARPLNAPEVASIHVKNTEYYYRWVNYKHSNGRVYMERKAMGFTNATNEDVDVLVGDTASDDKEIRCGDVILMKIPFSVWAAHVKKNMLAAMKLQNMRRIAPKKENLSSDVFADEEGARDLGVFEFKGKVTPFDINDPDAIINSQKSEDAEKARKEVARIRERIAAESRGKM
jgi:hypothetical protein